MSQNEWPFQSEREEDPAWYFVDSIPYDLLFGTKTEQHEDTLVAYSWRHELVAVILHL